MPENRCNFFAIGLIGSRLEIDRDGQVDLVYHTEHYRDLRLAHAEIFKGKAGSGSPGGFAVGDAAGHVPGERLGDAMDGHVAGDFEGDVAGLRNGSRQTGYLGGHKDRQWILRGLQDIATDKTVAHGRIGLQGAEVDRDLAVGRIDAAIRLDDDQAGNGIGFANRITGQVEAGQLFTHSIGGLALGRDQGIFDARAG